MEWLTDMVLDRHQIVLARARVLGAEVSEVEGNPTRIQRLFGGIAKLGGQALDQVVRHRQSPMCVLVERGRKQILIG